MGDQDNITQGLIGAQISRRSFLKWSAALGSTAALAGGLNAGLQTVAEAAPATAAPQQTKWVAAAC